TNEVRDSRALLTHAFRCLVLREIEILHELEVGQGFVDAVQIRTLNIFHERDFERLPIGGLSNHDRNLLQSREFRGSKPSLPRDQLISISSFSDDEGLDDPVRLDRSGKLLELFFGEIPSRLVWVRDNVFDVREG